MNDESTHPISRKLPVRFGKPVIFVIQIVCPKAPGKFTLRNAGTTGNHFVRG